MNSNKIINLVDFYQSIGIEYFIDDINKKSLQNAVQEKPLVPSVVQPVEPKITPNILSKNPIISKPIEPKNEIAPVVIKKEINLDHITTLDALKEELLKFDECSLKKTAINTVFGCGDEKAEIMVVGEAPGAEEDASGEPFVGRSGKLLMKAIESIGLTRDKIFITNTIFWRPPGNRNPTIIEMQLCFPFIKRMIEIINPKMIIIVGKVATGNLIKTDEPIGKMRGKWYDLDFGGKTYLSRVVFHPSYLLRNSTQKKAMWLDLLEIKDKIKSIKIEN